jgi:hypothetical protein
MGTSSSAATELVRLGPGCLVRMTFLAAAWTKPKRSLWLSPSGWSRRLGRR